MSEPIRRFLSFLLVLQLILPYSTFAAAVGEFTSVVGDVTQTSAKEVITPVVKSPIEMKDLIATARTSSATMVFSDDSTITLSENTKLEIKEFLFKDSSRKGIFSLAIGKLTADVKKYIGGDNVFEVYSPTVGEGVRGTGFEFIEALKDGKVDSNMATVSCTEGSLNLSAFSATGAVVSTAVLEAGQMAVIIGGIITISTIAAIAAAAAIAQTTETGAAGAAGGAGAGTGGAAAAGGGTTTATATGGGTTVAAGGASGGAAAAATVGTAAAATGLSTAAIAGIAIGGAAAVGGAAAAAGGGGGGGSGGGGSGGGSTGQTTFEISLACTNLNNVRTGQTIIFQQGVGRWATPAEMEKALAGHYAVISLDGVQLNVYYEGATWHTGAGSPAGYGNRARANWVATSGTHTVTGLWTIYPQVQSCTFKISK